MTTNWEVKTLDELIEERIVELGRGKIISKKDLAASPGHYPVYSSAKNNDGKFGEYGEHMFDEELITWSVDGGGRLFHREKHKFSVTNVGGILRIRKTDVISYKFLFYCLTLLHSKINFDWVKKAHPSVIRKLYTDIPLPSITEQARIVSILDEAFTGIDTAIANTEKNLANARELFESYLDSVFTRQGEGWIRKKLGEIAEFKNGLNYSKDSKGKKLPVVGVGDFQNNYYVPIEKLEWATIDGELDASYEIKKDDVLTVRSNGSKHLIGRCMLVPEVYEQTSFSGFVIRIRVDVAEVNPQFFLWFMKSRRTVGQLTRDGGGANINNINQKKLSALSLCYPDSLSRQLEIIQSLTELSVESKKLESIHQQKLNSLTELKQSLLQKAFSGELTSENDKLMDEAVA